MIIQTATDAKTGTEVTIVVVTRDEAVALATNLLEQVTYHPNAGRREFFEAGQYLSVEVLPPGRGTAEIRKERAKEARKTKGRTT